MQQEYGEEDIDWEVVLIKKKDLMTKKFLPARYRIIAIIDGTGLKNAQ